MHEFYEPQVLARLQNTELQILKDFMELCDSHGLLYFGIGGTGIGALRHGGFIPWDDDIDIAMPRRDFEQFLSLAKKEFAGRYYLLNNKTNENYPMMTTRLCKCGTVFQERVMKDVDCPFGIFLDLYVMDNIADGKLAVQIQAWTAWFWSKLLVLSCMERPYLAQTGWTARVIWAVWCIKPSGSSISARRFSAPTARRPAGNMRGKRRSGWRFFRTPTPSGTWWTRPGCFRCGNCRLRM